MASSEYDGVGAFTCTIFCLALSYAQSKFCYSGADAVYTHCMVFPFPVNEKA